MLTSVKWRESKAFSVSVKHKNHDLLHKVESKFHSSIVVLLDVSFCKGFIVL